MTGASLLLRGTILSLLLFFGLLLGTDLSSDAAIRAHVRFLADDLLEGRETAKHGQKVAARYIAASFEHHGLKSFYPDSDDAYFHTFELYTGGLDNEATTLTMGDNSLHLGKGFEFFGSYAVPGEYEYDLVFAGYGYRSKKKNYLDYEGLDLKGKIAVIVDGYPPHIAESYKDSERRRTHLRKQKTKWARKAGAAGLLILSAEDFDLPDFAPPAERSAGWLSNRLSTTPAKAAGTKFPILMLDKGKAKSFLGEHYASAKAVFEKVKETSEPAAKAVEGAKLRLVSTFDNKVHVTENVVGYVEGTDPVLKNEYVVLSAHYDHLGVRGDKIYNGADDNASGTALLMDLARKFSQNPTRRSVVFLALTAEEKGLIGSRLFLDDPPMTIESIVANINIDMVSRNDMPVLGMVPGANDDVTSMNQLAKDINETLAIQFNLSTDMDKYHHRSDHYNFVKKGVPAIFLHSGGHDDYHEATDTWEKVNYEKIVAVGTLIEEIMRRVSVEEERPYFLRDREGVATDEPASESKKKANNTFNRL